MTLITKYEEYMMNRIQKSEVKIQELFGESGSPAGTVDQEFMEVMNRFTYGDVAYQGNLTDRMRELITIVVLTASQLPIELRDHVGAALNAGATPVEIIEAVFQCAPYTGFPKARQALHLANEVMLKKGVTIPVESQKQVTEESRFDEGLKVQKSIFGNIIDQMHQNAPQELKHIQQYLSAFCFGDIYTRSGLNLQERELLTLSILISLGGCESQVKSHIFGNMSVGNTRETLIAAITACLPYIGFPRTLNALTTLNEVMPEQG